MEEEKSGTSIVTKIVIGLVIALFAYGIFWLLNGGMDGATIEGGH